MAKAAVMKKNDIRSLKKSSKIKVVKAKTPQKPVKKPNLKVVKSTAKTATKPAKAAAVKLVKTVKPTPKAANKAPFAKKTSATKPVKAGFSVGDFVVYPTHGVGRIIAEETQIIGEIKLNMLVIAFEKDRMTLRVPVSRAGVAGLRHISGNDQMQKVFVTLKARARVSRGMWSRRAQEYETKINSGNVIFIAEVVRDLHPNVDQTERSYSERMIYESAFNRLVGELAAAEGIDVKIASDRVLTLLRSKVAAAA